MRFEFNEHSVASYVGAAILGAIITTITLGICAPYAIVLMERWRAENATIDGHAFRFTGTGTGLFGLWIKWFLLIIITVGIYAFWVAPRLESWKWEHRQFADPGARVTTG